MDERRCWWVFECFYFEIAAAVCVVSSVSSDHFRITGWFGTNVTLPCRYDAQPHGFLFCWGRASTVLSSVDGALLYTQSPRYQLLGSTGDGDGDGDVSLTILDAQWSDNGAYGCRVEIPGWFNDHEVNIWLVTDRKSVV